MTDINHIRNLSHQVRELLDGTDSPAVAMSLTRCLANLSLAAGFLGDDTLGPELADAPVSATGAGEGASE